jgi:hypothetical protein
VAAGDLWTTEANGDTTIWGDVNGDAKADLKILVHGVTGLTASDFLL